MTIRRKATGRFELPIPAADAVDFFTPEGERRWVPGWSPIYPAIDASEDSGTVFITSHGDVETVWVIESIDRVRNRSSYARTTPGHHAGTVRVRCDDQPTGGCVVTVEYDMTSLAPDDPRALDAYGEDAFVSMMEEWSVGVADALASSARG